MKRGAHFFKEPISSVHSYLHIRDKNKSDHLDGFRVRWANFEHWGMEEVQGVARFPFLICTRECIVQQVATDRGHHHLHVASIQVEVKFINLVVFAESLTLQQNTLKFDEKCTEKLAFHFHSSE